MALDIVGPANAPNATTIRPADTRTFGATDTWTKDCTSPVANDGTKIQAGFLNGLIGQVRNFVRGNGQTAGSADIVTQDNADDSMMLKSMQHLVQRAQPSYAADTGTVNHIVAAFTPAVAEHKIGQVLRVKVLNTNTSSTADFAPNGLAAKAIKRLAAGALQPSDLQAGGIVELAYDGTQYQIISYIGPPAGGSTQAAPKLIGVVRDQASQSAQTITTSIATAISCARVVKNNLSGTSTFTSNTTLTVGTGEAGIWNINAAVHTETAAAVYFQQIFINVNGVQVFTGTTNTSQISTAGYVAVSCNLALSAGDVVQAMFYHQKGSNMTLGADQSTNFSALLISAY